ncbi:GDYXXLXY domain-containing protein [Halanaerobacter jeridensis]|uniref:Membrane-anchored protein n=1 Tax=Halanaerobacter jeridensis TaxID=706427 RepID=A0A939BMD1_9FIRM|nr:GDYXXLXY domain-containing protein [Halanaerobacter jeridensis]MBM7556160.1 putative membrane-anchored protein [Halanaerobacter jeridensis]
MNKKVTISLFVFLAVIQLAVPAVMISKRELTLRNGERFKFATAPIDPYDAFRGRYVRLNFAESEHPLPSGLDIERGEWVYAHLKKDENNFAQITNLTLTPPVEQSYLKVKVRYINRRRKEVMLEFSFDRYYLEEEVAKVAEKYYQQLTRRQQLDSYVTVRVNDGFAVLEELYLDGQPILEYVKKSI